MMFCAFANAASKACSCPGRTSSIACSRMPLFEFPPSVSGRLMTDRLDVVSIGVEYESAIVVRVVVRAYAGLAVVAPAGGNRSRIERIDFLAVCRGECDVGFLRTRAARTDPELRLAILSEAGGTGKLHDHADTEGLQRTLVEGFGCVEVRYRYAEMVEDHGGNSATGVAPW